MIDIAYNFEVVNVNHQARVMEVVYTAIGHDPILVGVRLPTVGEPLENVIRQFAPWGIWEEAYKEYAMVDVGTVGTLSTVEPVVATEVAPVTQESFSTDPVVTETIAALQLEAIRDMIQQELANAAAV